MLWATDEMCSIMRKLLDLGDDVLEANFAPAHYPPLSSGTLVLARGRCQIWPRYVEGRVRGRAKTIDGHGVSK
jgi:hypothetical protein